MCEQNDFLAHFELSKTIALSHKEFSDFATTQYLNLHESNPFSNMIRECQYCGEIWVKVSGCDGNTTCGNRDSGADVIQNGSVNTFSGVVWTETETGYVAKFVGNMLATEREKT